MHPSSCKDLNCTLTYREHLLSIAVSITATPSRASENALQTLVREKRWERDIPAYQRLRKDGLVPPQIDGSALRERQGDDKYDVESRPVTIDYSDAS